MRKRNLTTEKELINEINEAFRKLRCPPDDLLVRGDDIESVEIKNDFKGKHWKKIDSKFLLNEHRESLLFFSPMAFRFYLPAYMIVVLLEFDKADIISDLLVNALIASDFYSNRAVFEIFSEDQKRVVAKFLKYLSVAYADNYLNNEPIKALEGYWGKFS
mgnify:CR=1 FL=1